MAILHVSLIKDNQLTLTYKLPCPYFLSLDPRTRLAVGVPCAARRCSRSGVRPGAASSCCWRARPSRQPLPPSAYPVCVEDAAGNYRQHQHGRYGNSHRTASAFGSAIAAWCLRSKASDSSCEPGSWVGRPSGPTSSGATSSVATRLIEDSQSAGPRKVVDQPVERRLGDLAKRHRADQVFRRAQDPGDDRRYQ
jgi:hypothetical protein